MFKFAFKIILKIKYFDNNAVYYKTVTNFNILICIKFYEFSSKKLKSSCDSVSIIKLSKPSCKLMREDPSQ